MDSETPAWGIEPVPDRLRVLGLLDTTLLWSNLGVSLLVIVAGTLLVDAEFGLGLSLPEALAAIAVGGLVGNLMLALAGLIGAQARVPGMVLLRAPLGRHGSYLPTALNVLQNLGWATFELIVIATAAAALSEEVFGFRAKWAWTLAFAALTTAFALLGPIGFVRRWVRRFALWAVIASLAYLTWWTLDGASVGTLWDRPAGGGGTFWQGIDVMVAMPVSWLPLIADYTRFSRDRRSAFLGSGLGYLLPNVWLYGLGALLLLSRGLGDTTALMTAIATGGAASALALLALTVDETDEPFANVYSTAVSLQNVLPNVPQRLLIVGASALATVGALTIQLGNYLDFLYLLGSCFVPLFGVLLADWLLAGGYSRRDVFEVPSFRSELLASWLCGFALYQWLQPVGPGWWTDLVGHLNPGAVSIGASLPSFAAAFALTLVAGTLARRLAPARA
jgi:putative hydroxymethylpyrimidine transporter CytX